MSEAKAFQIATVQAALKAFRGRKLRRFLVADEVGLGKTVVARDIVAALAGRAQGQLVVYYIANGGAVASQNKARLVSFLPEAEQLQATRTADRLALIAVTSPPKLSRVAVYALTPETSFPGVKAKLTGGRALERAYVALLLAKAYPGVFDRLPPDFFQLEARSGWAGACAWAKDRFESAPPGLVARFREALAVEFTPAGQDALAAHALSTVLRVEAETSGRTFIGRLRRALCLACLSHQPPDIVILDEFQRYRDLIGVQGLSHPLMRQLLQGPTRPPALLLLSATPYKLFATRWEESRGAAAHRELFELLAFLAGSTVASEAEALFKRFGDALRRLAPSARASGEEFAAAAEDAADIKAQLQTLLTPYVGRTERDAFSTEEANLEPYVTQLPTELRSGDVAMYRHLVQGVDRRHRPDAIAYWSSVPLPAQALGQRYALSKGLTFRRMRGVASLTKANRDRLTRLDWPDAKLRALSAAVPTKQLALPWAAPSLPWWPLGGPWDGTGDPKLLMFSRFRATPPAVTSLLSFDVEAQHVEGRGGYDKAYSRRRLKLSDTPNPVMAAFHPSAWLIRNTDPLRSPSREPAALRRHMRGQIAVGLKTLGVRIDQSSAAKRRRRRPIGRLLPALEQAAGLATSSAAAWSAVTGSDRKAADAVAAWREAPRLVSVSRREVADLAEFALAAPGVALGRALWRHAPDAFDPGVYPELVRLSWQGLRAYLDNPVLLPARRKQTAVDTLLQATIEGCLESVLDEHLWMRSQVHRGAAALAADLREALTLFTGGFTFQPVGSGERIRLRAHAAVAFGEAEASAGEDGRPARPDEVRHSFNSPFWPHVLATTSVGQEGLDFHPWCSRVLHWDLPSNPLDLEQREGRVQRYAGLAIRRCLSKQLGHEALDGGADRSGSPWLRLASLAETRHSDDAGLTPWWILPGATIQRHIFLRPFGRDEGRFRMLREQRFIYRLALGQPNQEDLLEMLAQSGPDLIPTLRRLTLDLCPLHQVQRPFRPKRK